MERPKCCGFMEQLTDLLCVGQFEEEKAWKELSCLTGNALLSRPGLRLAGTCLCQVLTFPDQDPGAVEE